jgi:hypothetical protein
MLTKIWKYSVGGSVLRALATVLGAVEPLGQQRMLIQQSKDPTSQVSVWRYASLSGKVGLSAVITTRRPGEQRFNPSHEGFFVPLFLSFWRFFGVKIGVILDTKKPCFQGKNRAGGI